MKLDNITYLKKKYMKTKQVIVIRKDLHMRQGKAIAQGAHASLGVILNMMYNYNPLHDTDMYGQISKFGCDWKQKHLTIIDDSPLQDWLDNSFTKITLYVNSEEELLKIYEDAVALPRILITDNGTTEFNGVPTKTAVAIGPCWNEDIDKITGNLKLF